MKSILVIENDHIFKRSGEALISSGDNSDGNIVYPVHFKQTNDLNSAIHIDVLYLLNRDVIIINNFILSPKSIEWLEEAAKWTVVVLLQSAMINMIFNPEIIKRLKKNKNIIISKKNIFGVCLVANNYRTINRVRLK